MPDVVVCRGRVSLFDETQYSCGLPYRTVQYLEGRNVNVNSWRPGWAVSQERDATEPEHGQRMENEWNVNNVCWQDQPGEAERGCVAA